MPEKTTDNTVISNWIEETGYGSEYSGKTEEELVAILRTETAESYDVAFAILSGRCSRVVRAYCWKQRNMVPKGLDLTEMQEDLVGEMLCRLGMLVEIHDETARFMTFFRAVLFNLWCDYRDRRVYKIVGEDGKLVYQTREEGDRVGTDDSEGEQSSYDDYRMKCDGGIQDIELELSLRKHLLENHGVDECAYRIYMMDRRYGMTREQIALKMGVSTKTLKRRLPGPLEERIDGLILSFL